MANRWHDCPKCSQSEAGPGRLYDHDWDDRPQVVDCDLCEGTGEVLQSVLDDIAGIESADERAEAMEALIEERDPHLTAEQRAREMGFEWVGTDREVA